MFQVPKGKDKSLVHHLIDMCLVNDDEWMGTHGSQGQMPWVQGWQRWLFGCIDRVNSYFVLPPFFTILFPFLDFVCITRLGSREREHVVYDISSYQPLKVGQFIAHQGLGRAWVPQWFGGAHIALGTSVMAIIRGRAHARLFPMCYIRCPSHLLHFIIFFFFCFLLVARTCF